MLGYDLIEDKHMFTLEEDWSRVRSPARAARRLRQGKRQHPIPLIEVPLPDFVIAGNYMIGHPKRIRQLLAAMEAKNRELSKLMDDRILSTLQSPAYTPTATAEAMKDQAPFTVEKLRKAIEDLEPNRGYFNDFFNPSWKVKPWQS